MLLYVMLIYVFAYLVLSPHTWFNLVATSWIGVSGLAAFLPITYVKILCWNVTLANMKVTHKDRTCVSLRVSYTFIHIKDGSFANKSVWRKDSSTRTYWPDSKFHFSLVHSFVLTHQSLCCSLFSYQIGEEDWEPANCMLSRGHCRWILANE